MLTGHVIYGSGGRRRYACKPLDEHTLFQLGAEADVLLPVALSPGDGDLTAADLPDLPLVDGRGAIWWPKSSDLSSLRDYTLVHQVVAPYDFTATIRVAAREFMPDVFIVLGPGTTLGGAVAQSLVLSDWRGLDTKAGFRSRQDGMPRVISMGDENSRALTASF